VGQDASPIDPQKQNVAGTTLSLIGSKMGLWAPGVKVPSFLILNGNDRSRIDRHSDTK